VTKPPTPNTEEAVQESLKLLNLGGAQNFPNTGGALSAPPHAASSPNPAGASSGLKLAESPRTS
jgi:hypothetical protein